MDKEITPAVSRIKKKAAPQEVVEYVLPLGGNGWVVKNSSATKFTVITDSKKEAVSIARSIEKSNILIWLFMGEMGMLRKEKPM